jgi:hypothetical protein
LIPRGLSAQANQPVQSGPRKKHTTLTLLATKHVPVDPKHNEQPTLYGDFAVWRMLLWLLTKDEPGIEEKFPKGRLHISNRGQDKRARAVISGDAAWVER